MSLALSSLRSPSIKWAAGGWAFFIVENVVLSENRTWLIDQLGDGGYHAMYGTISTAAMGSVGYAYFRKVRDVAPLLWPLSQAPPWQARVAAWTFLTLGLTMASQALPKLQIPVHYAASDHGKDVVAAGPSPSPPAAWKVRCPFDFADKRSQSDDKAQPLHGLDRVSRHAGLWSFALIGLGNGCLVSSIPQRIWWSMPFWVALVGGAHTDSRYRRHMGGKLEPEYDALTSNVPFLAMLSGRQGNVSETFSALCSEIKPLNAALATGVATLWVLRKGRGGVPKVPGISLTR